MVYVEGFLKLQTSSKNLAGAPRTVIFRIGQIFAVCNCRHSKIGFCGKSSFSEFRRDFSTISVPLESHVAILLNVLHFEHRRKVFRHRRKVFVKIEKMVFFNRHCSLEHIQTKRNALPTKLRLSVSYVIERSCEKKKNISSWHFFLIFDCAHLFTFQPYHSESGATFQISFFPRVRMQWPALLYYLTLWRL